VTLTKSHLIDAISETNGFPENKAAEIAEILIDEAENDGSAVPQL
jgi:hypothetical protein